MGRPYFTSETGRLLRRIPRALPCPSCDGDGISIVLDIDAEPHSFKAWAECCQCGTKGPQASRVVGPHGYFGIVEREAAWLWNAPSKDCMAGIQNRQLPMYTKKAFEKIWRRISNAARPVTLSSDD